MRKRLNTYIMAALIAALGITVGCDMPEEKKSVFRNAGTEQQIDSSKNLKEENLREETKTQEKKEQKKPQAFAKRDNVFI